MTIVKKVDDVGNVAGYWDEEGHCWTMAEAFEAQGLSHGPGEEEGDDKDYEEMTNAQLRDLLEARGVQVTSGLVKAQLVELARNSDEVTE